MTQSKTSLTTPSSSSPIPIPKQTSGNLGLRKWSEVVEIYNKSIVGTDETILTEKSARASASQAIHKLRRIMRDEMW